VPGGAVSCPDHPGTLPDDSDLGTEDLETFPEGREKELDVSRNRPETRKHRRQARLGFPTVGEASRPPVQGDGFSGKGACSRCHES